MKMIANPALLALILVLVNHSIGTYFLACRRSSEVPFSAARSTTACLSWKLVSGVLSKEDHDSSKRRISLRCLRKLDSAV